MIHKESHPCAGVKVKVQIEGKLHEYRLEDWWDRVTGESWMESKDNPIAIQYAIRSSFCGLPLDNEVVYGKIGLFGHLIHVNELALPSPAEC